MVYTIWLQGLYIHHLGKRLGINDLLQRIGIHHLGSIAWHTLFRKEVCKQRHGIHHLRKRFGMLDLVTKTWHRKRSGMRLRAHDFLTKTWRNHLGKRLGIQDLVTKT